MSASRDDGRTARQFACLARLASSSVAAPNLESALEAALDGLGWDSASIHICGAADDLHMVAACGRPVPGRLSQPRANLIDTVLKAETPLLLQDLSPEESESLGIAGAACAILSPLRAGGKNLGILLVSNQNGLALDPDDLPFVDALTAQICEVIAERDVRTAYEQARLEIEAAHGIARTASESVDFRKTLDATLAAMRDLLRVTGCAVYRTVEPDQRLQYVASLNVSQAFLRAVEDNSLRAPARAVLKTAVPALVGTLQDYSGDPKVVQSALDADIQSGMILPIYVGGQGYGVLSVYDSRPRVWSEADVRVGQLFASFMGGGFSRVHSLEHLAGLAARLRRLHEVSRKLIESGGVGHSALVAVQMGCDLLRADSAAIQIYDEKYRLLKLISVFPSDAEYLPAITPIGRGVCGKAAAEMQTVTRPMRLARVHFDGFAAATPLRSHDALIGVLAAFRTAEKGTFSRDDIEFMELFASIVATAMHNASLLARSEELGMLLERTRLASELHDTVGGNLAALLMKAELAQSAMDSDLNRARSELTWISATLKQSIVEMRRILSALKPVELERIGLPASVRRMTDDYSHNCGIPVVLRMDDALPTLDRRVEYALYRAVNECLNNVRKHAGASLVRVSIHADSRQVVLVVEDNGRGFDPSDVRQLCGIGLKGLQDSTQAAGGKLEIESEPGVGARIAAKFPVYTAV